MQSTDHIVKHCYATKIGVEKITIKLHFLDCSLSAAMENKYYTTPMSWVVV